MDDSQFYQEYQGLVYRIASKYSKGAPQEAEDLTQDILLKAISKRGECKGDNFKAWVGRLAENHCRDKYRAQKAKKAPKFCSLTETPSGLENIGIAKDAARVVAPKKYPCFSRLQEKDPEKAAGLERSLEMIHDVYRVIPIFQKDRRKITPLLKATEVLEESRKKLRLILGDVPDDIFRVHDYHNQGLWPKFMPAEYYEQRAEEASKYEPAVFVLYDLSILIEKLDAWSLDLQTNEFIRNPSALADEFLRTSILRGRHPKWGEYFMGPAYRKMDLAFVQLSPLKMVYNVWNRALSKGKYGNRRMVAMLLKEFRDIKQGTHLAHIFEPLKDGKSMEALRVKSLYNLTPITKDLAAFIFRKSFGGPADPDAPTYERTANGVTLLHPIRGFSKK